MSKSKNIMKSKVIECTLSMDSNSFSEDTKTNLERNLSILDQFTIAGNDSERNWEKIKNIIKN